ncbi:MAG: hypothetical protein WA888_23060, partial [Burkholderiaceae bacterium]
REARLDQEKKSVIARIARQERARDTRRKVLLGALSLYRIELNDTEHDAWIKQHLPGFLTRDGDKALFDDLLLGEPSPDSPDLLQSEHALEK